MGFLVLIVFEKRFIRFRADASQVLTPTRLALLIASGIGLHNFSEGLPSVNQQDGARSL